ncbi:MAG: hypothetical protein GY832_11165 [Chloroflexi bacterium]|nr:hypothetical protein [Chloroflexota bacterium]
MSLQMPGGALFAFGIQQGTGADDYARMTAGYEQLVTADDRFYYYALTEMGLQPVKGMKVLPQEIGGRALPSGAYSTGTWMTGGVGMIPRMDNRFGRMLLAGFGEVLTTADTTIQNHADIDDSPGTDTGIHTHKFRFNALDQYFLPWVSLRRMLPHNQPAERVGEIFQDGHLATLMFGAQSAAPLMAQAAFLARVNQADFVFNANPGWAAATYDGFHNFGVTNCDGFVHVNGVDFKAVGVSIQLANQLLPPEQSMYIGSMHPLDFPCLGRALQVTATFLVEDWDLYVSMFAGGNVDVSAPTSANVNCPVYTADLDVMIASQQIITGVEPYRIRVRSDHAGAIDNVTWAVQTVQIAPNRPVVMQIVGTVLGVDTGDPIAVYLQNAQTDYALPT